jgi:hypothetical protein
LREQLPAAVRALHQGQRVVIIAIGVLVAAWSPQVLGNITKKWSRTRRNNINAVHIDR